VYHWYASGKHVVDVVDMIATLRVKEVGPLGTLVDSFSSLVQGIKRIEDVS
jgi:hypothetical protein